MHQLQQESIDQAQSQYHATMTPENRIVRDDVVTPFCMAMKIEGFTPVLSENHCHILRRCPECKSPYSGKYSKDSADYWGCPGCLKISPQ